MQSGLKWLADYDDGRAAGPCSNCIDAVGAGLPEWRNEVTRPRHPHPTQLSRPYLMYQCPMIDTLVRSASNPANGAGVRR